MDSTNQPLPDVTTPVTTPDASPNAELARMMAISLNGGFQPAEQKVDAPATDTPQTAAPAEEIVDVDTYFKTNYGWDNADLARQEIENLRKLKDAPREKEAIQFANDEAKRVYQLISSGKEDEVLQYFDKRNKVKNVDNFNDEQLLKHYLRFENPLFDDELINDEYNTLYSVNEDKFKDQLDQVDTLALRKEKLRTQQRTQNDVAKAKEYFNQYKSKIELPAIEQPIDPSYLQWKQEQEQLTTIDTQTMEAYKALSPKAIETKINFTDEANKINFDFQFEPDAKSFQDTVDLVADMDKFYGNFKNSDGSPNRQKFLAFVHRGLYTEKYIMEAINQAKNATIVAKLPNNSSNGMRTYVEPNSEPSEFQKQMERSLRGYM